MLLEWIKDYWCVLVVLFGWATNLVVDHKEISQLKLKVAELDDNFKIGDIELLRESIQSLEKKYDKLHSEIGDIKVLLSEISTKMSLIYDGKLAIGENK